MHKIVREFEIAPDVWSSQRIVVGRTPSRLIAEKAATERNAAESATNRRLHSRYMVILDTEK